MELARLFGLDCDTRVQFVGIGRTSYGADGSAIISVVLVQGQSGCGWNGSLLSSRTATRPSLKVRTLRRHPTDQTSCSR